MQSEHSTFFKLFPPPHFLLMMHAGLDISDDAIRVTAYNPTAKGRRLSFCAEKPLPPGLVEGGDIRDEKQFLEILSAFAREHRLLYVKVSLPEEKAYLFQTDIPSVDTRAIQQNIEFKLEENVPLSAADAVFYIDVLPTSVTGGSLRASISVVPRVYVEKYISMLQSANLIPVAFEVAPKSIARASVPKDSEETRLILHIMNKKTGIYIVSGGAVHFSSTIPWGSRMKGDTVNTSPADAEVLSKEISRVHTYWVTRTDAHADITCITCVGRDAHLFKSIFGASSADGISFDRDVNVWRNAFDINHYIPPISQDDSLRYAVSAGLALPL